jgi:hypothetical protein
VLKIVVDWDGTVAEDSWPKLGDWMPGAVDALHELTEFAVVEIDSCRLNPYEKGMDGVQLRPPHVTAAAIADVRRMLDGQGLHSVRIHTTLGKPPADYYIDNKGVFYPGRTKSWEKVVEKIKMKEGIIR